MSIIVKGEPMPEACAFCPCFRDDSIDGVHAYQCKATFITYGKEDDWIWNTRPNWCPLVELKPHGALIDRDALLKEFELAQKSADMHGREYANAFYSSGNEISTEWWAVEDMVENAPVVIEAEGE